MILQLAPTKTTSAQPKAQPQPSSTQLETSRVSVARRPEEPFSNVKAYTSSCRGSPKPHVPPRDNGNYHVGSSDKGDGGGQPGGRGDTKEMEFLITNLKEIFLEE